jgi:hypothetical protein
MNPHDMTIGQAMSLTVRPISFNAAREWIARTHRHLREPVTGWLFGVEILMSDKRVGVACVGRPKARMLQDGLTCEVTRVAVVEGARNACSFAYGALRKAAIALGYQRVLTYTRHDEHGVSLRASGWTCDGEAGGGEWTRPSRTREATEDPVIKRRWVYYASDAARLNYIKDAR